MRLHWVNNNTITHKYKWFSPQSRDTERSMLYNSSAALESEVTELQMETSVS